MSQHVVDAIWPETRSSVDDEVAPLVALIHAELWLSDDSDGVALAVAYDALGELRHHVDDRTVASELEDVQELIAEHLAGTIDLRDRTRALRDDMRWRRTTVEERLSRLLFDILGLP